MDSSSRRAEPRPEPTPQEALTAAEIYLRALDRVLAGGYLGSEETERQRRLAALVGQIAEARAAVAAARISAGELTAEDVLRAADAEVAP